MQVVITAAFSCPQVWKALAPVPVPVLAEAGLAVAPRPVAVRAGTALPRESAGRALEPAWMGLPTELAGMAPGSVLAWTESLMELADRASESGSVSTGSLLAPVATASASGSAGKASPLRASKAGKAQRNPQVDRMVWEEWTAASRWVWTAPWVWGRQEPLSEDEAPPEAPSA